ncbi:DUF1513 domain-containing protein [uncultured Roseovarius sp.]|uniref:DUF1513 domain-containing protein n=1 Tax=uncultured Roseovarius sp. TaxID=293344 RepID=UPI0026089A56|nr:DUF1513 domain-containing protein [uncultured Roseovarius sp.]
MTSRRHFLGGLLTTGLMPHVGWAETGNPAYLSAARLPSGRYALFGLNGLGEVVFGIPLPGRGHAAAAHPTQALAVAFARRPGRFAMVINCKSGQMVSRLEAPEGHHFYGHGAFSGDGAVLLTTENHFNDARGMIGMWDAKDNYRRIGAMPSGGVGPHELRLMPDGETFLVANGGIETHPDAGRAKLNLPDMRPNLSYLALNGALLEQHQPPVEWHRNSMRHLAVHADGHVAVACQWQGDLAETPPLLATHRRGQPLMFHETGRGLEREMQGYAGSVAFSGNGGEIALTGPRGGVALIFETTGKLRRQLMETDICGVAAGGSDFVFTTGTGRILVGAAQERRVHDCQWDNHLVAIG